MNNPEKRFMCGAVSASIWSESKAVEGEMVKFHSISITKAYKIDNEWKHTHSFNAEDLPKVALVANEAYRYIRLNSTDSNEQNDVSQ